MINQMTLIDNESNILSKQNMLSSALSNDIPYDLIYESARKEASRKKPAFFIHKYFARRITCNYRMMLLGMFLSKDNLVWDELYKSHTNDSLKDVTLLDPFMGGGTTIFESLRLNMNVIGCDLQPLSKFVTKALVKSIDEIAVRGAVKKIRDAVASKIMQYHQTICPKCGDTADVMYTFHVKTVTTESSCKEHSLYSSFVIAMKNGIFTLVCPDCGNVYEHNFKQDGISYCPSCGYTISDPKEGYVSHGQFHCSKCDEKKTLSSYVSDNSDYPFKTKIIALEYYCPHCESHGYKRIDKYDDNLFKKACVIYDEVKDSLPIPTQDIPKGYNTNQILNHGYTKFSDLFNKRQLLCLGILLREINNMQDKQSQFWLQLAFSGMLEMNNMFCRYQANAYKICNIFFNHAYVPISMPVENNVWGTKLGTGTFVKTLEKIIRGKKFCEKIYDISTYKHEGKIGVEKVYSSEKVQTEPVEDINELEAHHPLLHCGDSRDLSFIPSSYIDVVLTDPPFGANVMYSELIDFFHVWNYYSSIGTHLGFTTPLSPKKEEVVVNTIQNKTQREYGKGLQEIFTECHRVMKDCGYLIFSFHDKGIESWISLLSSVDGAGFTLYKTYPLHSETRTGAHTSNKNSIALDIMLICKKKATFLFENTYECQRNKIMESTHLQVEICLNRLSGVNAEITIPDIKNILISSFFALCTSESVMFGDVIKNGTEDLKHALANIEEVYEAYDISDRRTGWWSKLFKEKWAI
jgi:adenine-specific DNA methylase